MIKTSEIIWQDKQHQVLLKLIEQINAVPMDESIFHRLHEYAELHFCIEEEYMRQLDYPHLQDHVEAHNKFRSELDTMMQEFTDYDDIFRQALSEFLREWLMIHILNVDKQLEDFILKSDVK